MVLALLLANVAARDAAAADGYWADDNCYYVTDGYQWFMDGCYVVIEGYQFYAYGFGGDFLYFYSYELGWDVFAVDMSTGQAGTAWVQPVEGQWMTVADWVALNTPAAQSGSYDPYADPQVQAVLNNMNAINAHWIDIWTAPACNSSYNGCG
jgi:hypothetical protein